MRTMYDSITAGDIPSWAQLVAGYVDGLYRWSDADWARFPGAVKVRIAVFASTNDGHVLDIETGDATPAQAPGWAQGRRGQGVEPSVYMNLSTWPQVRSAFQNARVPEPHYWVAQWDGVAQVPAGAVAKQYADPGLSGGHYDLSAVADYWPGVDATPGSGSGPGPMQLTEEEMVVLKTAGSITGTLVAGPLVVDIPHTEDAGALQGAGVPIVVVTQDFLNLVHQGAAALQGAISGQLSVSGNLTVK